jgi:hypothetical protein
LLNGKALASGSRFRGDELLGAGSWSSSSSCRRSAIADFFLNEVFFEIGAGTYPCSSLAGSLDPFGNILYFVFLTPKQKLIIVLDSGELDCVRVITSCGSQRSHPFQNVQGAQNVQVKSLGMSSSFMA